MGEAWPARGAWPALKLASLLVWGEDVRDRMALDLAAWTRDRMHSSYWRLGGLFGRAGVVRAPLGYPDPAGEFFGYGRARHCAYRTGARSRRRAT